MHGKKQLLAGILQNDCFEQIRKTHWNTCDEVFFNKVEGFKLFQGSF